MPLSPSMSSYDDIRTALDRALASEKGIRIPQSSSGMAIHLRQRMYKLRVLDRKASLALYPEGNPRRGASVYDGLTFRAVDANVLVLKGETLAVEEL